jgi:hypothetical protein
MVLLLLQASQYAPFPIHWNYAHSMPISRLMMLSVDIRTLLLNVHVAGFDWKWTTANYAGDA